MMLVNLVILVDRVILVNVVIPMILVTVTHCQDHILTKKCGLYGLEHHVVEMGGGVTRRDDEQ